MTSLDLALGSCSDSFARGARCGTFTRLLTVATPWSANLEDRINPKLEG
jgi:hypothetical protein